MEEITLKQMCEMLDVSRRAVQGYETYGLVHSTGRNKMGHLLYDSNMQDRVRKVREMQRFGFSLKEICEIIDAEPYMKKEALIHRAKELDNQIGELEYIREKIWEEIGKL